MKFLLINYIQNLKLCEIGTSLLMELHVVDSELSLCVEIIYECAKNSNPVNNIYI